MERRKFMIGAGALVTGSSAAVGTGAFTSASIQDRQVTIEVDDDANSQIALIPGNSSDISQEGNELQLDLTGEEGEGVNTNSVYTWGDHDNPEEDYAFKIVNNSGDEYNDVTLKYEFEDFEWVPSGTDYADPSFVRFEAYDDYSWGGLKAPNRANGASNPESSDLATSGGITFGPGEEIQIVVEVNTTGSLVTKDDELTGSLSIEVE